MPGFDYSTVEKVQQANSIVDVVSEYVSLAKKGKEMVGICPFHEDHRPSMYVNDVKQIFKCFACGAGGDVIKFVQLREHLSFKQAIERLAERAGIQVQWAQGGGAATRPADQTDPVELARVNDWAVRFFQSVLEDPQGGADVRQYLLERHINPESIKQWRLGLAPRGGQELRNAARSRNIPEKLLHAAGLVTKSGQDRFVDRLMFPIIDVSSRVIGMGGRTLCNDTAKYVNSPATVLFDKSNSLYGLDQGRPEIARTQMVVVVEGYTDCIMAHQAGVRNVVATLGTSFAAGHARMLRRYAKTVVLLFDGDTAGAEAANRALVVCLKHNIDIRIATISGDKDPCEFIIENGVEAFSDIIHQATDVLTFKWGRLMDRFDADHSLVGRKEALEEYLQTIAAAIQSGNVSRIERGLIVNRLSNVLGLSTQQLEQEISQRVQRVPRGESPEPGPSVESEGAGRKTLIEREILEILLNEPALFPRIREAAPLTYFETAALREVAGIVFLLCEQGVDFQLTDVLARIESVTLAQKVTTLVQEGQRKGNFALRLDDLEKVLRHGEQPRKRLFGMVN